MDIFGAGTSDPPETVAGVPVRPEASLRLDGYDRVVLASLGDAEMDWRKLQAMGVPQEKAVTLFSLPLKQTEERQPETAGAQGGRA